MTHNNNDCTLMRHKKQLTVGSFSSGCNTSSPSFHETEFAYQAATKQDTVFICKSCI